jgi:hypothetical protein
MISEEVLKLLLPAVVIPVLLIATDGVFAIVTRIVEWIAESLQRFY